MYLNLADKERIDDPTPQQVSEPLSRLRSGLLFVVLNADEEHFIQAIAEGEQIRVEWRQEKDQRYMIVSPDVAQQAFAAYLKWDEATLQSYAWKRLTAWNDPFSRIALVLAAIVLIALAVAMLMKFAT